MKDEPPKKRSGRVFDEIALEYDRSRPSYPNDLVDYACQFAGIGNGDQVLEVGCGSGQLTRSLLARGLHVTALEPGEHLISLAGQKLRGAGHVEFENVRFEDAAIPRSRFRAVFSASAFHWVNPEISWRKAARVLVPGGTLALIQYCGLREKRSIRDHDAILSALNRFAPEIAAEWPSSKDLATTRAGAEQRRENVSEVWAWIGNTDVARPVASTLFSDVQMANASPTLLEQTADELNALLRTTSLYQRMSPSQRRALESQLVAIHDQLGRPIRSSTVAVLITARRSSEV